VTVNYREAYGIHASNPRRDLRHAWWRRIELGLQDKLYLGNLDARRG